MRDALQEFMTFNRPDAQRNQERMRFKIARRAESLFGFFRGTLSSVRARCARLQLDLPCPT